MQAAFGIGAPWFCTLLMIIAGPMRSLGDEPIFVDATRESGLEFHHFNGMTGELYIAETMGSGCALFDYDNDGDLDAYLVQGCLLGPGKTIGDARFSPQHELPLRDRLFRNDSTDGKLSFTDVTASSGIDAQGYGMGVTVGDYDNDGWLDLYLTNYGHNQLWHNNGDGSFSDATDASGSDDARWSVSAAFVDFDLDGDLDLYLANYAMFDFENHQTCPTKSGADDYCGPSVYPDTPDRLLVNQGDGRFRDATTAAKITAFGAGLGVVAADFNGDFWPDIYVANDADPNLLWINQKDGTFVNDALFAGCAVNATGAPEASMGVDADDFDGDGDLDLFMTHLTGETHTLYLNDGKGFFEDKSQQTGVGTPSRGATGFGTAWFDYDNDGWLDLLVVNGNVYTIEALARARDPYPLHQPNQLFRNLGDGTYDDVTARAGPAFRISEVSRGAAIGDIDNDGDSDILVSNNNGPARILINQVGNKNHWLGLRILEKGGKRDAVGTLVAIDIEGQKSIWRRVKQNASYASSLDPRVLVGLGGHDKVKSVTTIYPGGTREQWSSPKVDRYLSLERGKGSEVKR